MKKENKTWLVKGLAAAKGSCDSVREQCRVSEKTSRFKVGILGKALNGAALVLFHVGTTYQLRCWLYLLYTRLE